MKIKFALSWSLQSIFCYLWISILAFLLICILKNVNKHFKKQICEIIQCSAILGSLFCIVLQGIIMSLLISACLFSVLLGWLMVVNRLERGSLITVKMFCHPLLCPASSTAQGSPGMEAISAGQELPFNHNNTMTSKRSLCSDALLHKHLVCAHFVHCII